jgi:hypothetical protein
MRRVTLFSAMLAFLLGQANVSWAQTATGQITGTVAPATRQWCAAKLASNGQPIETFRQPIGLANAATELNG